MIKAPAIWYVNDTVAAICPDTCLEVLKRYYMGELGEFREWGTLQLGPGVEERLGAIQWPPPRLQLNVHGIWVW
jgi:hypothetical protein